MDGEMLDTRSLESGDDLVEDLPVHLHGIGLTVRLIQMRQVVKVPVASRFGENEPSCSTRNVRSVRNRLGTVFDLDQVLAGLQTRDCGGQLIVEYLAESGIRGITASNPQHLRRRPEPLQHLHEIFVLGHHDSRGGAGGLENR